jgi:SAM-dependent methyltransferase
VTRTTVADTLACAMDAWLDARVGPVQPGDVDRLRMQFEPSPHGPVNYTEEGRTFARAYHVVNFRKCLAALNALAPTAAGTVVDLGCGSGAAAAAALAYLADLPDRPELITVVLVDRCRSQLDLAAELINAIADQLPMKIVIDREEADWPPSVLKDKSSGLILACHVVTENSGRTGEFLAAAEELAGPNGAVIVVEREDDPAWPSIQAHAARSVSIRLAGSAGVPGPDADARHRVWRTRWLMLIPPPQLAVAHATRRYFEAWRTRDSGSLDGVFTKAATYSDKPFQEPVQGLDEIIAYWNTEVVSQQDPEVGIVSVVYGPQSAHVEWEASFHRGGMRKELRGTMVLEVERDSGLVNRLREYYRSTPQEDSGDVRRRDRPRDRRDL